jgi:glycosyltransferase involved in cell wall biosynthesis
MQVAPRKPFVSAIIPTFNKAAYLDLTLASWCRQSHTDYELIVVNDGSTDETRDVIAGYRTRLPLQCLDIPNSGRAGARNCGVREAKGDILVFSDDDRVVLGSFVEQHVSAHQGSQSPYAILGWQFGLNVHPVANRRRQSMAGADVVGISVTDLQALRRLARTIDASNSAQHLAWIGTLQDDEPVFHRHALPLISTYGNALTECPLAWCCGTTGNLSLRAAAMRDVGLFDEAFSGWGFEDVDLLYRLKAMGTRIVSSREACNYHQNHSRSRLAEQREWRRNAALFLIKHNSLEVVCMLYAVLTNMPLLHVCRILDEAQLLKDTALLRHYGCVLTEKVQRLLQSDARKM